MPIVEYHYLHPEYPSKYKDVCLVKTLQSMVGQALKQKYVAPENLYALRAKQIANQNHGIDIGHLLSRLKIIEPCLIDLVDQQDLNTLIAGLKLEESESVVDLLNKRRVLTAKASIGQAVALAEQGLPVGISIIMPRWKNLILHMFHLGFTTNSKLPVDLSDRGGLRDEINTYIHTGQIADLIEESRARYDCWNMFALI